MTLELGIGLAVVVILFMSIRQLEREQVVSRRQAEREAIIQALEEELLARRMETEVSDSGCLQALVLLGLVALGLLFLLRPF